MARTHRRSKGPTDLALRAWEFTHRERRDQRPTPRAYQTGDVTNMIPPWEARWVGISDHPEAARRTGFARGDTRNPPRGGFES